MLCTVKATPDLPKPQRPTASVALWMGRPLTTVSSVHVDLLLSRTGVGVWVSPACLSQTSNLLPLRRAERTHPVMRLASFRRWSTSVIFDFKTAMSTCKEFSVLDLRPYCPRRRRVFRVRRPPNAHILDSPIWDAATQNLLKGVLPLHSLFFPNTPIEYIVHAELRRFLSLTSSIMSWLVG